MAVARKNLRAKREAERRRKEVAENRRRAKSERRAASQRKWLLRAAEHNRKQRLQREAQAARKRYEQKREAAVKRFQKAALSATLGSAATAGASAGSASIKALLPPHLQRFADGQGAARDVVDTAGALGGLDDARGWAAKHQAAGDLGRGLNSLANRHPISGPLTDLAINVVTAINRDAMKQLDTAFKEFSTASPTRSLVSDFEAGQNRAATRFAQRASAFVPGYERQIPAMDKPANLGETLVAVLEEVSTWKQSLNQARGTAYREHVAAVSRAREAEAERERRAAEQQRRAEERRRAQREQAQARQRQARAAERRQQRRQDAQCGEMLQDAGNEVRHYQQADNWGAVRYAAEDAAARLERAGCPSWQASEMRELARQARRIEGAERRNSTPSLGEQILEGMHELYQQKQQYNQMQQRYEGERNHYQRRREGEYDDGVECLLSQGERCLVRPE